MAGLAAARVGDPFGHSSAMSGVLVGLAVGALVGVAILATGGLGAIAIGAAIATTGGAGLAGQAIGQTMEGPVTGTLATGSPGVRINGRPATMAVLATGVCSTDSGGPRLVASGSASVFIDGKPAARVSERMDCSAVIRRGSANVSIGGPSKAVLPVEPEVPTWLSTTMTAMAIGGTVIATGGVAAAYGIGPAVGSLVGGAVGGHLGGMGGSWAAGAMGYGATGQAIGGVMGSLAGGAIGGAGGFRGGQAAAARFRPTPAPPADPGGFPYTPRKMGQIEPGAVPNTAALQAEMDAGAFAKGRSAPGYPDLPASEAANFGDDIRPWNGDAHNAPIQRVIGQDKSANGSYWQAKVPPTEAEWRAGSAVKNDWNGNGGYVESPSAGLRGWIGPARAQMSSDNVHVLPGSGEQIWLEPGSAKPGPPIPTPWSRP